MSMANATIDERVASIEEELLHVNEHLHTAQPLSGVPWWKRVVGADKDDAEFLDVMRLEREYRESLRPNDDTSTAYCIS